MIFLDPREGSHDYLQPLHSLGAAVDSDTQLDFGDVAFWGSGRAIGIELKKLDDMLQCITTGRFAGHQLPGLAAAYDEAYLLIEGLWRPNPSDGVLEQWRAGGWYPARGGRGWMYRDFVSYLTTMEIKGGVRVVRSTSQDETARAILALYDWWQDYDGHKSHLALNRAQRDAAIFIRPTFARRVACELDGIGFERSSDVAAAFPTVRRMVNASEKDWRTVKGIGKTLAKRIVEGWDSAS